MVCGPPNDVAGKLVSRVELAGWAVWLAEWRFAEFARVVREVCVGL